jgi:hypothetical protein
MITFIFILNCNNTLKISAIKNNWIFPKVLDTVLKVADLPKNTGACIPNYTASHPRHNYVNIHQESKISQKLIIT